MIKIKKTVTVVCSSCYKDMEYCKHCVRRWKLENRLEYEDGEEPTFICSKSCYEKFGEGKDFECLFVDE